MLLATVVTRTLTTGWVSMLLLRRVRRVTAVAVVLRRTLAVSLRGISALGIALLGISLLRVSAVALGRIALGRAVGLLIVGRGMAVLVLLAWVVGWLFCQYSLPVLHAGFK